MNKRTTVAKKDTVAAPENPAAVLAVAADSFLEEHRHDMTEPERRRLEDAIVWARAQAKTRPAVTRIAVSGKSPFPLDMLRRDQCWPAAEEDAAQIYDSLTREGRRTFGVMLYMTGTLPPNVKRWESFGWSVHL
jgi:hypothetical protein